MPFCQELPFLKHPTHVLSATTGQSWVHRLLTTTGKAWKAKYTESLASVVGRALEAAAEMAGGLSSFVALIMQGLLQESLNTLVTLSSKGLNAKKRRLAGFY